MAINNKPANTLRCGNIKATIWQNVSEMGGISPGRGAMGPHSVSMTSKLLSALRVRPGSGSPLTSSNVEGINGKPPALRGLPSQFSSLKPFRIRKVTPRVRILPST
jgi:hypothetical protein